MTRADWLRALGLALGLWLLNLAWLGRVGLFDVDEAIFAEATREMVVGGDFVTPHYNDQPRYDKPPLTYWLMAVPIKLLGPTPAAARLLSATAAALLALLLAAAGQTLFGGRAGLWAAAVMGVSLHGFALAHWAATDMLLTLLMTAGALALWLADETEHRRWLPLAGAALALATLTKGPVAVVLPLGSWLVYLAWRRRLGTLWRRPTAWAALVYVALLAPWCLAIYRAHGPDFFRVFLLYHNADRLMHTQSGHGGGFYYFLVVAAAGLTPWLGTVLAGLRDAGREAWRGPAESSREGRAAVYCLIWFAAVLVLYTASKTKLANYIAPCYPAAALLAGAVLDRRPLGGGRRAVANLAGWVLLGLGLAATPLWGPKLGVWQREMGLARPELGAGWTLAGLALLAIAAVATFLAATRHRRADGALAVGGAAAGLALWLGLTPLIYHYQQATPAVMGLTVLGLRQPGDQLATLNVHIPSLAFVTRSTFRRYLLRPEIQTPAVLNIEKAELTAAMTGRGRLFLITQQRLQGEALDDLRRYLWAERDGWRLYCNRPKPPGFELPPSPWTAAGLPETPRAVQP
jgi:4-amino-4-deoxy-L-arabinose transferase-like glycosyltransferase